MKTLGIAAAAALVGGAVLLLLFPRLDPSATAPVTVSRDAAVKRVRELSSAYGVDTTGWRAAVYQDVGQKLSAYLSRYPGDPAARLFTPFRFRVVLIAPDGRGNIQAGILADGRPLDWKTSQGAASTPVLTILNDFAGPHAADFRLVGERWEWAAGSDFPFKATLAISRNDGTLQSIKLAPEYDDAFDKQYQGTRPGTLVDFSGGVEAIIWTWGFCWCVSRIIRRKFNWRVPLLVAGVQVGWAIFAFLGGAPFQYYLTSRLSHSAGKALLNFLDEPLGTHPWTWLWLLVFAAAAFEWRTVATRDRWHTLDLVVQGKILNRPVGAALATGMLSGIGVAAIPYIVAWIKPLPGAALNYRSADILVAPVAPAAAIGLAPAVAALSVFGFLLPGLRFLRIGWLQQAAFIVVGTFLVMSSEAPQANLAALLTSALLFFSLLAIYRWSGALSVIAALIMSHAAVATGVLLVQPVAGFRESAVRLLALGGALTVAAVYWAVNGREPDAERAVFRSDLRLEAMEAAARSDRERLQAEFEVARKAQQEALPSAPPEVPGYTLAGACEPAQQVGGDLYDFLPLSEGRLSIAVADVSGKGVPAALYMMVTKGLLGAVTRDSHELAYILDQVNLHLYRACRKKVFVTMAAVVLDSATDRLQYGRAGHNPVVWRRTRQGHTSLIKPPGLGLGMTSGERFRRTLEIQELQMEPEDALVLYSDGVTEAVNSQMEQFGEERLMRSVEATDGMDAAGSRDAILRDLAAFMGTTPPRDDVTLVVIRKNAIGEAVGTTT